MRSSAYRRGSVFFLVMGLAAPWVMGGASPPQAEKMEGMQLLVQQGKPEEAREQLKNALKEFPNYAGYYDLLGVVEALEGNYVPAEQNFKKAIQLDPLLVGAYLNLGRLYQQNSRNDRDAPLKALTTYGKVLKFDPANPEANYQSAALLEHGKSYKLSLEHISRLPPSGQQRAQALSIQCADWVGLGDRKQAGESADRLIHSEDLSGMDILLIIPLLESNHWDDVELRLLQGAVDRHVAGFDLLTALGRVYERAGKMEEARVTLEQAARSKPDSAEPLMELARVTEKQKDFTAALGYLAHARDLDPKNPVIHFFMGEVCVEENLLEEAYNSLRQAVQLAPDNPNYLYALGVVAQQRADPREAITFFKRYCTLKPDDPRGRLQLGISYFNFHRDDLAGKELEVAIRHPETAAAAHFILGRIANQHGDYAGSMAELQKSLAADPNFADPLAEEGIVFMKQKDYVSAQRALSRAIELAPDHYVANLNLMMLYERTGDERAAAQAKRFEVAKQKRAEQARLSLRSIQILR